MASPDVDQAAREKAAASGVDQLSRRELDLLKLEVKKKLRLRSLPRMQLVEAAWQVQTGEVRLFSTSKTVATLFVDRFEKTFAPQ